jgi:protein-L-isoaspartate(D-aspartate) O-methyltransferase
MIETAQNNIPREIARFNMIEQQIRTWEVLDPAVLQLLNEVPRENFVPRDYLGLAFADIEIPIGLGTNGQQQTMLSPKLEGRLLQSLSVNKQDTVLHIGTGSGYFTALLASLAKHVTSVEINPELSAQAQYNLQKQGIQNVTLMVGNAANAKAAKSQFDAIVYTVSSPAEPPNVRQQLNIGGRLLIVLGNAPAMQATLIERVAENSFKETVLFETCIPALIDAPKASNFEF